MNDIENRNLILSNFYRAIVGTTESLVDRYAEDRHNLNHDDRFAVGCRYCESEQHAEHKGASEDGYVDVGCVVCVHDNPEFIAERESARRSFNARPLPMASSDDPRMAFAEKIEASNL